MLVKHITHTWLGKEKRHELKKLTLVFRGSYGTTEYMHTEHGLIWSNVAQLDNDWFKKDHTASDAWACTIYDLSQYTDSRLAGQLQAHKKNTYVNFQYSSCSFAKNIQVIKLYMMLPQTAIVLTMLCTKYWQYFFQADWTVLLMRKMWHLLCISRIRA